MIKKFDKKDYEILRIMTLKGTTKAEEIAKATNISAKTIRNRMAKYKANNVYSNAVLINPDFFGYTIKVDFFIKKKNDATIKGINQCINEKYRHNIMYLGYHWNDGEDISIQAIFRSTNEIMQFKSFMNNLKLIHSYKMTIVPMVKKDTHEWMPHQSNFKLSNKDKEELEARRKQEIKSSL